MPDGPDEISMNEFDEQAEELLELESDLSSMAGAEMDPNEQYESGTVLGAERVLFDAVPDTYPTTILSPHALRLDVQLSSNRNTSVYIAWPEQLTGDTSLDQLLSTVGVPAHSFADILGCEIPVERDGSHYVVDFEHKSPDTSTTETNTTDDLTPESSLDDSSLTSPYWYYIVIACLLSWILYFPLHQYGSMVNITILAWLIFPVGMYFDNQHVRERSTWTPNKWVWPVLSLVWFLNVPAGLVYLYKRHQAEFPSE